MRSRSAAWASPPPARKSRSAPKPRRAAAGRRRAVSGNRMGAFLTRTPVISGRATALLPSRLLFFPGRLGRRRRSLLGSGRRRGEVQVLAQLRLDFRRERRVLLQELLGVLAPLADPEVSVGEARPPLLRGLGFDAHVG